MVGLLRSTWWAPFELWFRNSVGLHDLGYLGFRQGEAERT